jgi:hypothetical protein
VFRALGEVIGLLTQRCDRWGGLGASGRRRFQLKVSKGILEHIITSMEQGIYRFDHLFELSRLLFSK